MSVRYSLVSADDYGVGTDYWPRVTVRNSGRFEVTLTFDGHGIATDPTFADYPLEMSWGGDDGPLTVLAGKRKTVELGKEFGEVLSVFNGGHITSIKLSAEAVAGDGSEMDDGVSCPVHVTRS